MPIRASTSRTEAAGYSMTPEERAALFRGQTRQQERDAGINGMTAEELREKLNDRASGDFIDNEEDL